MSEANEVDAVVVGGGVIGLCAAYALRRRGLSVAVVERGEPGGAASRGNGGWICPSLSGPVPAPGLIGTSLRWMLRPDSPLYLKPRANLAFARWLLDFWRHCNARAYEHGLDAIARLNHRTMALFDEYAAEGVRFEQHAAGLLFLFLTRELAAKEKCDLDRMTRYGYPPGEWLEPGPLREVEPAVGEAVVAGILAPAERHVRPESLNAGLVRRLGELGVAVSAGESVVGFERADGRVSAVRTGRRRIGARWVVLAAGVWTAELARQLGARLPLEAGKGYSVTFGTPPIPLRRPLYCTEARVGCSPYEGAVRVLGTMELSGINTDLVPRRLAALKSAPARYLRGWGEADLLEEWTGMRPLTPDGLPAIGAIPSAPNAIVATGHAMLGVTLGPATGELVADIVGGTTDPALLAPFRLERF